MVGRSRASVRRVDADRTERGHPHRRRIAGHADPNSTLRIYGHLMRGAMSEAAERFEPLAHLAGVPS